MDGLCAHVVMHKSVGNIYNYTGLYERQKPDPAILLVVLAKTVQYENKISLSLL